MVLLNVIGLDPQKDTEGVWIYFIGVIRLKIALLHNAKRLDMEQRILNEAMQQAEKELPGVRLSQDKIADLRKDIDARCLTECVAAWRGGNRKMRRAGAHSVQPR